MQFEENLKKYAELVISMGVNLQKGQQMVLRTPIECADFARLLAETAYQHGAKEVIIQWKDEQFAKIKYTYSPLEVFETMPRWQADFNNSYAESGACFVTIAADDPELLAGVDPAKLIAGAKASHAACKPFYDRIDSGELVWNIISVPTAAWAKKVFPNCSKERAMEQLWNAIFKAVRVDTPDPVAAWARHRDSFQAKKDFLNGKQFCTLHYTNSLGTDLTIGMPDHHIWEGGGDVAQNGVEFFPNMPTEEVFCAPHRNKVNGKVVASMPLNHNGNLITNFSFTFRNGEIVDYSAETGAEILEHILKTDDGSRRLGEVALVPSRSPISDMKILFYNTLFDENASCHLAIGSAYQSCVQGGLRMSKEELLQIGLNDSVNHIDFMIGTEDLKIVGTDADGKETIVFEEGNWAF
jgi:aminopeptidase